jgi:phenol/toluene 2-monooxygenase (NADH) P2/A2
MTANLVGVELTPGDEADAVADAVAAMDPDAVITRLPAVVLVEAPGRLEIDPVQVREYLGRDWGVDDLQVIMASYFGFISRWEPDGVVLEWMRAR